MRGLQALVVGIVLGGVLSMIRDGGFRLGMRLVMLGFVGVDLRGGGGRECWTGSGYLARWEHFADINAITTSKSFYLT
jgi:hypothetical protein